MILCDPLGSRPGWGLGAQDAHLRDVAGLLKVCLDGLHLVHPTGSAGPSHTDVERVLWKAQVSSGRVLCR
jgi:hypothetical protein